MITNHHVTGLCIFHTIHYNYSISKEYAYCKAPCCLISSSTSYVLFTASLDWIKRSCWMVDLCHPGLAKNTLWCVNHDKITYLYISLSFSDLRLYLEVLCWSSQSIFSIKINLLVIRSLMPETQIFKYQAIKHDL